MSHKLKIIVSCLMIVSFFLGKLSEKKDNNEIVFVWEGMEKDIPKDGEFIQITGTDENTVYINAIDE